MGDFRSQPDIAEIVRELRDDYPAVDVTSVIFSGDWAGVGCCVIPQDRVLAIIAALEGCSTATDPPRQEYPKYGPDDPRSDTL